MQIYELRTQYSIYLMTLAIQNKGKSHLNNESIFNNIIKKENGVNPFLTVMNFKISFKTWLKHSKSAARLQRARENGVEINPDDEDSYVSKKNRTVIVDIEVEFDNEYTSEEDLEDMSQYEPTNGGKLSGAYSQGSGSNLGSSRDLGQKKERDYLASFNKKMTSKLRDRMLQGGPKGAKSMFQQSSNMKQSMTTKEGSAWLNVVANP
jgi:hypothetical protein